MIPIHSPSASLHSPITLDIFSSFDGKYSMNIKRCAGIGHDGRV